MIRTAAGCSRGLLPADDVLSETAYDEHETRALVKKQKARACITPHKNRVVRKRYDKERFHCWSQVCSPTQSITRCPHFGVAGELENRNRRLTTKSSSGDGSETWTEPSLNSELRNASLSQYLS